jgi:hypothetical protein
VDSTSTGDNLDILRRFIKDESVDLVYLDPSIQQQSGLQRPVSRTHGIIEFTSDHA